MEEAEDKGRDGRKPDIESGLFYDEDLRFRSLVTVDSTSGRARKESHQPLIGCRWTFKLRSFL